MLDLTPRAGVEEANLALVLAVLEGKPVWYRGQPYEVPPIPFRVGVRLDALRKAWDAAVDADDAVTILRLHGQVVRALKRLLRPVHPVRRFFWPALRNPFRNASNAEFNDLLGFCLICRMKSTIRGSAPEADLRSAWSSIKRTSWRDSHTLSRAG